MRLTLWVVRRKSDGAVLPMASRHGTRGGTHVEPVLPDGQHLRPPRTFHNERAAKRALTWWLKGRVKVTYTNTYNLDDVGADWDVAPDASRTAEEWAVVPATLEY